MTAFQVGLAAVICGLVVSLARVSAQAPAVTAKKRVTPLPPAQKPVDYGQPRRVYKTMRAGDLTVRVEAQLAAEAPEITRRALARLKTKVAEALAALPKSSRTRLEKLRFFLMYGPKSKFDGRDNGLEYFQKHAPESNPELDPNWGNAIVIYSAENYVRISDFWALKALVHEFAHAYQLQQWPEDQPDIYDAWEGAMKQKLYRNVVDDTGKKLKKAYAATNQLEYFAELSCMYFIGCNYPPFDRKALEAYDADGYNMIRRMWKVGK